MASRVHKADETIANFGLSAVERLYSIAVEENLITAETLKKYQQLRHDPRFADPGKLESYIDTFKGMNADEKLAISRVMGLECQILNALHNGDRKQRVENVQTSIKSFIERGLGQADHLRKGFIDELAKLKHEALISIIHTTHPTVYHSADSIRFESAMTRVLEDQVRPNLTPDHTWEDAQEIIGENNRRMLSGIDTLIRERVREISSKPISHARKITVPQETQIETDNIRELKKYAEEFELGWNGALRALKGESKLSAEEQAQLKMDKLNVEWRTWGMGADADGRPNSTSIELYNAIHANSPDGVYKGTTLDLRQNAAEHADVLSGLIQRLYNMSDKGRYKVDNSFKQVCEDFVKGISKPGSWKSEKESIMQELDKDQQADFIKLVLNQGFELVPKNVTKETMEFNKQFHKLFVDFVGAHHSEIGNKGYDPNKITYTELYNILDKDGVPLQDKLAEEVYDKIKMPGGKNFEITPQGFYMHKKHTSPSHLLLSRGRKLDEDGEQRPFTQEERVVLVDVLKRLQIVNDAIDHAKPGSNVVADRHQIANFGSTRDFYALLALFKETGIVEMKYEGEGKGKHATVTKAKMGIQPLLETSSDMRNAPEMFRKLLEDPLARSYYETRGIGEFMVGFSDGARSAGNFASEWEIHQCMNKLNEVFAEAATKYNMKPVPLRFFRGHGRGTDRGGPVEYGIEDYILPDVEAAKAVRDETWQSDLPLDMRMSRSYGSDTFAQATLGTMQSALVARQKIRTQTPEDIARDKSYEEAITFIAKAEEETYRKTVSDDTYPPFEDKNNPGSPWDQAGAKSLGFINLTPDQKDKTSRPAVRNATPSFQKTRAIGVEYGFNMAGLPAHNVGLAHALDAFVESGKTVKTKDGREVSGQEALVELYENSRFFRGVITKVSKGMDIFQPEIARKYAANGKKEVQDHVETIIAELEPLPSRIKQITDAAKIKELASQGRKAPKSKTQGKDGNPIEGGIDVELVKHEPGTRWEDQTRRANRNIGLTSATAVDQANITRVAQAMLLSYGGKHNVKKEQNPDQFEAVRNAIFVASERVSNRFSSPPLRDMAAVHVR